jgi:hypothetical protein
MKLTVYLGGLENLRRKMGAKERLWVSDEVLLKIRNVQQNLIDGVENSLDKITISNGGLLSYDGQQIAIYIKDHTYEFNGTKSTVNPAEDRRRLHVFDCGTLEQARNNNRYDRFVQTSRTNNFEIVIKQGNKTATREVELLLCQNCLKALNYKGYRGGKTEAWYSFNLEEFFAEYSTFFAVTPRYHDFASPSYDYTKNWSNKSREVRTRYSWTCAECKVVLDRPEHQKYLHTHHQNGIKSDNSNTNLIPLCEICHAKEPSHQHMPVSDEARRIIEALRLK